MVGNGGRSRRPAPVAAVSCGYESPDESQANINLGPRTVSSPAVLPQRRPGYYANASPALMEEGEENSAAHASLNDLVLKARNMRKVGIRDRIACIQWTWFTMTMATGGIANVISGIPFRSRWLTDVGLMFFFINLILFVMICILIALRFHYRPGNFLNSFTDQFESLFTPAIVVSIATIFITICEYGIPSSGPWLVHVMEVMFWVYVSASVLASAGIYLILWSTLTFPIHTMTPVWVFPAYPLLLTAPFGGTLISAAINAGQLEHLNAVAISFASVCVQGAAFLISFMICAAFLYRLMTQKLPRDAQRPGVFISIGPFAFTVAGIVMLGNRAEDIFPADFLGNPHAVFILKVMAFMVGLWLWGMSIWFFLVSTGSLWKYLKPDHRLPFQMTWFSFVFPNTALVTATLQLGGAFESHVLEVLGCVLAGCLVLVWGLVFACMIKALWRRELLWPKDED